MNLNDLLFFRESLLEAVRLSGSTVESISRPVYLSVCSNYGLEGLSREQIVEYPYGWTQLKKDAMKVTQVEEQGEEIPSLVNAVDKEIEYDGMYELGADVPEAKDILLQEYDRFVKINKFAPKAVVFRKSLANSKAFKDIYNNNIQLLDDDYRRYYKENAKRYLCDKRTWDEEYIELFNKELKKHKKFVFVSVGSYCNVDFGFLSALRTYAEVNDAMVIGLPLCRRHDKAVYDFCAPPETKDVIWYTFDDVVLNSNLRAMVFKATCTGKSSITSMNQLVSKYDSSIIVPGVYQQLKYIPVIKGKTPNMIASTGCCTEFDTSNGSEIRIPTKSEKLAMERLSMKGALVVELGENDTFTARNIEADKDGSFIDLAVKYNVDGSIKDIVGSTFVIGDLHAPNHNEELINANLNAIWEYNCSQVVLHDSVNMTYISHHNADKAIFRAQLVEEGKANVLSEVNAFANVLEDIAKIETVDRIIVPYSNHPAHFERFIQDIGRMAKDDINLRTSLHTALAMLDNKNVLQYLTEELVGVKIDKVEWMEEDEGRESYGVQVGLHGSEKVNGGRMTPTSTNNAFSKTVLAHRHTAGIDGDTITVGIACEKDQGYNHGLSSWTESSAIVYPNGKVQLLTFVNVKGEYKLWL